MNSTTAAKVGTAERRGADNLAGMLAIMSAQIDAALRESDAPAATLVETAHAMGQATQTIAKGLMDFSGSPTRVFQDLMMLHDDMHARSTKAATAIQFHDRLVQCLAHVSSGLSMMAEFVSGSTHRSADDWKKLQDRIRALLSMEGERTLFDTMSGTTESSGANGNVRAQDDGRKVELF